MFIILTLLAELFIISFLILFLYQLKPRFGLGPLFVLLGSNQYFQTVLSTSFQIDFLGDYTVSPGAIIIFCSGLFAILLIYIKEGVRTTQRLILGIVLANLSFTVLVWITNQQEGVMQGIIRSVGFTPELFKVNYRIFFVGTATLILDAFLMIILYEFLFTKIRWLNMYFRLLLVMMIILSFDAVIFMAGSFWGQSNLAHKITGQLIAKIFTAVIFATILYIYLRYFDKGKKTSQGSDIRGKEDIFSILTYKGRFEKLQTEKVISEKQLQSIISEKTEEQNKIIRRFTLLSSIRELRMDKYSIAEQVNEFLSKVKAAFETDVCTIHLLEKENLVLLSGIGLESHEEAELLDPTTPFFKEIIQKKKCLAIEDTDKDLGIVKGRETGYVKFIYKSCLAAPLLSSNKVIGIIKLYSRKEKRIFTTIETEHLQMVASQIAHIIENAQLFEQNEKHKEVLLKQIVVRKKAQEAIKESEEKYRTLVEQAADAILIYSFDGTIYEFNNQACDMLGYTREEFAKLGLSDILVGDIVIYNERKNKILAGDTINVYRQFIKKDGSYFELEISVKMMADGKLLAFGRDISERKKAEKAIKETNEQLRQLTGHLQTIREEERSRIGQEIHDQLGQHLTVLKMDVSRLKKNIPMNKNKEEDLVEIISELDNCLQMVRKISADLRPSIIDDLGIIAAMEWLAEDFERRTEIITKFFTNAIELKLPQTHSIGLFRIFQESLTNVARHAEAKEVVAELNKENGFVTLTIADNGKGFDENSVGGKRSLGLLGMRERTLLMNGDYKITSVPGKGTEVKVTVPL